MSKSYIIPERLPMAGRGLGRHINHDDRSKAFRVKRADTTVSKEYERKTPILDQGNVGSCVGNASCGVLGTEPFYSLLMPMVQAGTLTLDEAEALAIYSLATKLDNYPGDYPNEDTGSDGLSGAKACQQLKLISGYTHAFSMDDFLHGMQSTPAIVGTNWLTGMDDPATDGRVAYKGQVRGGHEFEANKIDVDREQVWFCNSWGTGFGVEGKFYMTFADFEKALADDGDATFFTPLDQPAPQPEPVPTPPSDNVTKIFSAKQAADIDKWANAPHIWHLATVASKAWKGGQ